jgi:hypothetical protein
VVNRRNFQRKDERVDYEYDSSEEWEEEEGESISGSENDDSIEEEDISSEVSSI